MPLCWLSVQCDRQSRDTYLYVYMFFVCFWRDRPKWARASSFTRFLDHTQRRTTIGISPLDEWSARRRDLHLTTQNTHNRQTSMPPVGFEATNPAGERPQTYTLFKYLLMLIIEWKSAEFIDIYIYIYICNYANTEHYQERVLNLIFMQVCEQKCCFKKCGATAHRANETSEHLREFFGDHICRNVGVFEGICER